MTKVLYLVRHAKAEPQQYEKKDYDRNLDPQGEREAVAMGKALKDRAEVPDLVLASSAARTAQTANLMLSQLPNPGTLRLMDELYQTGVGAMLKLLNQVDRNHQAVMLVGHNPSISLALQQFAGPLQPDMPTCSVVKITFNINDWPELNWQSGEVVFFDYPANHLN
jgi:phosphohistidine phosphatase